MAEQENYLVNRRQFMAGGSVCLASGLIPKQLLALPLPQNTGTSAMAGIADVFFDLHRVHKWDNSNGDTWDAFWADDDTLYTFNCDGRGFGGNAMNLAINKLAGDVPELLTGSQVNPMDEYGKAGQKESDNATWKACGQECIDGIFYAFVSRNVYGSDSNDPLTRQTATNASLIKSIDKGQSWSRTAKENYEHPMWPGGHFGAPFFVHYGRNGGQVSRDGAEEYVYACSTNGFWNDGDSLILGRIKRSLLPNLKSTDWEYLSGADGSDVASWSRDVERATPILSRPAKCGQTPITYVPELGLYLLISWYNTERMKKWYEPNEIRYDFYQASHPWGPWTQINSFSDSFLGPMYHMYGPSICARFQQRRGADIELSLFTSGCPFNDVHGSVYKMWHIPVLLRTASLPSSTLIKAADPQVRYKGAWFPWTTTLEASGDHLPRASQTEGSEAELSFTGTGIEYIAEKSSNQGRVDIFLDGVLQESTSLLLEDFPVFLGVTVFSKQKLPKEKHTIRIVNAGDLRINLGAFRVYS